MRSLALIGIALSASSFAQSPRYFIEPVGYPQTTHGEAFVRGGVVGGSYSDGWVRSFLRASDGSLVPLGQAQSGLGTWLFGVAGDGTGAGGSSKAIEGHTVPVRWNAAGVLSELPTTSSRPLGIVFGHAAGGHSAGMIHTAAWTDNNDQMRRAAYWSPAGTLTVIDLFNRGIAWDVNSKGWATGFIDFPGFSSQAFLWKGGSPQRIVVDAQHQWAVGQGINEWGEVTGLYRTPDNKHHVFVASGTVGSGKGSPVGYVHAEGDAINDAGVVAGRMFTTDFEYVNSYGMVWSPQDGFVNVNDLIDNPDGWTVKFLRAIDRDGTMSGHAFKNGIGYPVLLKPVSPVAIQAIQNTQAGVGGTNRALLIELNAPAPAGGALIRLATNDTAATLPATVTVAEGETTASATLNLPVVTTPRTIGIRATLDYKAALAEIEVVPPTVQMLSLTPSVGPGGSARTLRVELNAAAPIGGTTVNLTKEGLPSLALPPTMIVPAGQFDAEIDVETAATATPEQGMIFAKTGSVEVSAQAGIVPPSLASVDIPVSVHLAETPLSANLTLDGPAPAGGSLVTLSYPNATILTGPASFRIPAGSRQGKVALTTKSIAVDALARINATLGNARTDTVRVVPSLRTIALSASKAKGGMTLNGTVVLGGGAPVGGLTISLSSTLAGVQLPATVKAAAGATSVGFTVKVLGTSANVTGLVKATYKSRTVSTPLQLLAPVATSLTLVPSTVKSGASSTARVFLDSAAGPGGFRLLVTSSHTSARVPASVTVLEGAKSAAFTVTTVPVRAQTKPVITVKRGTMSKSNTLTVNP